MKTQDLIKQGQSLKLNKREIETIILYNAGLSKSQFFLVDDIDKTKAIISDFKRVSEGFPLEYVTCSSEFYGRSFYVDNSVLIPRIDTELLIERALDYSKGTHTFYIDVGIGSGIIPITLLKEGANFSEVYGIDISPKALVVAQKNIIQYGLQEDIVLSQGSLLSDFRIGQFQKHKKVLITANLPYIKDGDHENMSQSTISYEPDVALYGGKEDGFDIYRELIKQCMKIAQDCLEIELFLEIGFDQTEIAKSFCGQMKLDFEFYKDSATIERVLQIHF